MYSPCASLKMCFFLSMIFSVPFCIKPEDKRYLTCGDEQHSDFPDVVLSYRKPFPNVSGVQPSVFVHCLCCSFRVFQVSMEYIWSFDTHLVPDRDITNNYVLTLLHIFIPICFVHCLFISLYTMSLLLSHILTCSWF